MPVELILVVDLLLLVQLLHLRETLDSASRANRRSATTNSYLLLEEGGESSDEDIGEQRRRIRADAYFVAQSPNDH